MPLAARLLSLVALAVAPALGVVAYREVEDRAAQAAQARQSVADTSQRAAAEVRQIVENVQRLSAILAKLPEIRGAAEGEGFSDACSALLTSLRQDYPGQLEFGIANRSGSVVCNTQGTRTLRRVEGAHLRQAIETDGFAVGTFAEVRPSGVRFLSFAHPIRNGAGAVTGAVLAGLDLGWLAQRLRPLVGPEHAVLSVHDRTITFLARVPDDGGLIGRRPPPEVMASSRFADRGPIEATGADGVARIGAIVTLAGSPGRPDLHVAYGLSRDAVFAEMNQATRRGIALFLLSAVLAILAAWYGGRRFIRRPMEHLLAAAREWQAGNYEARVALPASTSEFGRLAAAYQAMADALALRERDLRLLINELNHRVKNTLATVQSIASQTLRNAPSTQAARQALEERLLALSRVHDVLTRESWEGAGLAEIVAQAVAPFRQQREDRVETRGPEVWLSPRMALAIAMALQELATNAVKYGALSNDAGTIAVTWSLEEGGAGEGWRLRLEWRERGGPPVSSPDRRGFGTRLIERSLAQDLGGRVEISFAPEGVVCVVDAPVATPARPDAGGSDEGVRPAA
ncbi:MAG TPA: HWE histidine kinase domain-containing protein [Microvirga sp.]|jgi:two-component sensor histidine kinase|nr:HWE histidine kinase domain-containing protein [Microvirga sp.]